MSKDFSSQRLRVVYTANALEFHPTDDSQIHDEDLIWSLYRPMLALFMITDPATEKVAREAESDDFAAEMKGVFSPDAMKFVEFFQGLENIELEQNPTRDATMFPVRLLFIDGEGMSTGPEGHAGLQFLKTELDGRETVTVAEIGAIADNWKSQPK
jgi:hypothetical protein